MDLWVNVGRLYTPRMRPADDVFMAATLAIVFVLVLWGIGGVMLAAAVLVGGLALRCVDTWRGLLVALLVLHTAASSLLLADQPTVFYGRFVLLGTLAVISLQARPFRRELRRQSSVTALVGLFGAWALGSTAWSVAPAITLSNAVIFTSLAVVGRAAAQTRWTRPGVLAGDLLAIWGCLVVIVAVSLVAGALGILDPFAPPDHRLRGLLANPNMLALVCLLLLPMTVGFARRRRIAPLPAVVVATGALACLMWTGSRAGLAAALVGIAAATLQGSLRRTHRPRVRPAALAAAALLVGVVAWGPPITTTNVSNTLGRLEDPGDLSGRSDAWRLAIDLWKEAPIAGHGFRSGETLFDQQLQTGARGAGYRTIHNGFLQTLAELGIIGASLLTLIMVASLWPRPGELRAPVLGMAAAAWTVQLAESSIVGLGSFFAPVAWLAVFMLTVEPVGFDDRVTAQQVPVLTGPRNVGPPRASRPFWTT